MNDESLERIRLILDSGDMPSDWRQLFRMLLEEHQQYREGYGILLVENAAFMRAGRKPTKEETAEIMAIIKNHVKMPREEK